MAPQTGSSRRRDKHSTLENVGSYGRLGVHRSSIGRCDEEPTGLVSLRRRYELTNRHTCACRHIEPFALMDEGDTDAGRIHPRIRTPGLGRGSAEVQTIVTLSIL